MEEGAHHLVGPGLKELFTGVHLLIVVGILYYFGKSAVMLTIKNRSRSIEKEIVDARVELEKMKHETERARQEIAQIAKTKEKFIDEIKLEGDRLYTTLVAEAKDTSQRILADAKLAADNEVQIALSRVKEEIVNRAVDRAVAMATATPEMRDQVHNRLFDKLSVEIGSHTGEL